MSWIVFYDHTCLGGFHSYVGDEFVGIITYERIDGGGGSDDVFRQQSVHRQRNRVGFAAFAGADVKLAHEVDDLVLYDLFHNVQVDKFWFRFWFRLGSRSRFRYG